MNDLGLAMSWKRYDGSFPGYGYQRYGNSRFGGRILWSESLLAAISWSTGDLSSEAVWQSLLEADVQWKANDVSEVNWNREW